MSTARDHPPEEAAEDTSFARGLRILLTVADRGAIRADELSSLLETPISTVYRYLKTLAEFGFVDRRGSEYLLGPRLLIGGPNVTSAALVRAAGPVLRTLSEETAETALLLRRVGASAVCLDVAEPPRPLRVTFEPGTILPLHAGAGPRVLLAFAPPEVLDEVLAAGGSVAGGIAAGAPAVAGMPAAGTATTADAPLDPGALRDALAEIAATRIARSEGEMAAGVVAVAVPIMRADGIAAALAVCGPEARCGLAWRARVARLLPAAAQAVVAALDAGG